MRWVDLSGWRYALKYEAVRRQQVSILVMRVECVAVWKNRWRMEESEWEEWSGMT